MSVTSPDQELAKAQDEAPPRRLSDYLEKPIVILVGLMAIVATAGWIYLIALAVMSIIGLIFG